MQYPVLAEVDGVGGLLVLLVVVTSVAELVYHTSYNAYFAALGDVEHRGQQIGAREAMMMVAGIVAPLLGSRALIAVGPRWMFAGVALVQTLALVPLIGTPNLPVKQEAPGALRAARLGPTLGVVIYNLAKASPCPFRFSLATEGGWDAGCSFACLIAAALVAADVSLAAPILLALPALAAKARLLWQHYPRTVAATATARRAHDEAR